tara:strand:- start:2634 stop:3338 length:705 start_codon:yes stop_codon:yes gene_type:complete
MDQLSKLLIQIVHYTKLSDRKLYIDKIFDIEGLEINYILDYDQETLKDSVTNYKYLKDKNSFLNKIAELWKLDDERYRILSDGEISCYFKHLQSLKNLYESEKPYGLILEDDILMLKPFKHKINKILKKFGQTDWDIIFLGLGAGKDFIRSNSKRDLLNLSYLKPFHPASNCAEAYLIKKDSAKLLYDEMKSFNLPYDWELAYKMYKLDFKVRWLYPPLFKQGSQDKTYKSSLR